MLWAQEAEAGPYRYRIPGFPGPTLSFYKWGKGGPERGRDLPRSLSLKTEELGEKPRPFD